MSGSSGPHTRLVLMRFGATATSPPRLHVARLDPTQNVPSLNFDRYMDIGSSDDVNYGVENGCLAFDDRAPMDGELIFTANRRDTDRGSIPGEGKQVVIWRIGKYFSLKEKEKPLISSYRDQEQPTSILVDSTAQDRVCVGAAVTHQDGTKYPCEARYARINPQDRKWMPGTAATSSDVNYLNGFSFVQMSDESKFVHFIMISRDYGPKSGRLICIQELDRASFAQVDRWSSISWRVFEVDVGELTKSFVSSLILKDRVLWLFWCYRGGITTNLMFCPIPLRGDGSVNSSSIRIQPQIRSVPIPALKYTTILDWDNVAPVALEWNGRVIVLLERGRTTAALVAKYDQEGGLPSDPAEWWQPPVKFSDGWRSSFLANGTAGAATVPEEFEG